MNWRFYQNCNTFVSHDQTMCNCHIAIIWKLSSFSQRQKKTCRTDNDLVLSITDQLCFRDFSYSHTSVLIKYPFDCQCFAFAGHSDWQYHKSVQHDGIDGWNKKFPKFQYQYWLQIPQYYQWLFSNACRLKHKQTNEVSLRCSSRSMSKQKTMG